MVILNSFFLSYEIIVTFYPSANVHNKNREKHYTFLFRRFGEMKIFICIIFLLGIEYEIEREKLITNYELSNVWTNFINENHFCLSFTPLNRSWYCESRQLIKPLMDSQQPGRRWNTSFNCKSILINKSVFELIFHIKRLNELRLFIQSNVRWIITGLTGLPTHHSLYFSGFYRQTVE